MKVCFSCPMARPVFEPAQAGPFGGSEVRALIFAQGLAARGAQVHVVVESHAPLAPQRVGDCLLHYRPVPPPLPRWHDEPSRWRRYRQWPIVTLRRGLRSLGKRLPGLAAKPTPLPLVLAGIAAEVYACFGVHGHAASVIATARRKGRPSVLFLASDTDLAAEYQAGTSVRNAYGQTAAECRFAIENASRILAQTRSQQLLLRERFGRGSTLIRNPVFQPKAQAPAAADRNIDVLWIGRADTFSKRADLALEVARRCPQLRFTLVMNPRDRHVDQQLRALFLRMRP